MATSAAEIEFIPDEEIEFIPDDPIEFIPDEPVDIQQEAARSTAGALQAVDLASLPGRLDWSEAAVQEYDALRQEQSVAAKTQPNTSLSTELGQRAMALYNQLQTEAPESSGAIALRQRTAGPQQNVEGFQRANFLGRGLSSIAQAVGLTPLATDIERAGQSPLGLNFQANIGAAAGGAAGAGLMMIPGGQPAGARSLAQMAAPIVAPMMGGITGAMGGGIVQEKVQQATETPEETSARQEALAQTREESPVASMIGGSIANAPFMRPSLSQFTQAMAGNRTAAASLGVAAAIGGTMGALPAMITGQPISLAQIAQSALENTIFNKPTRLGRALGLPAADAPTQPVQEQTGFEPVTVEPKSSTPQDIVPALNIGGEIVPGQKGDTHQDILNRYIETNPDAAADALSDFDTKANPNIFVGPEGPLSREQLQEQFGVRSSQELATLQNAAPEPQQVAPVAQSPEVATPQPTGTQETPTTPEATTPVVEDLGSAVPATPVATDGQPTGIRNAVVDANRAEAGIPARELPLRRSFPQIHEEARAALANDPQAGRRLISELGHQIRPLNDTEDAVLTFEQNAREQERTAAVDAVNNATDPDARDAAAARLAQADNDLFEVYQVGQQAGTANARGLNARRLMMNQDFTLPKMLNEHRAIVNGGEPNTQKQTEEVTNLYKRIADLESKLGSVESQQSAKDAQLEYRRILRETKKEAGEAAKSKRSVTDFMNDAAEKARQRIISRRGRLQVTVDPLNIAGLVDEAIIGASYVAKGIRNAADWSKQMLSEFGERIRPHLDALFAKATALADDTGKTFGTNAPKTSAGIVGGIKEGSKLEQRTVYDLARAHVNEGMDDFREVMTQVKQDLEPKYPGITERHVMDALSQYGKTSTPSKDLDKTKLREFRNLARLTSQFEDAQKGLAPLKTGPQRDKATAKVRQLQQQVNAAMRASGISRTSPESQIASGHNARVTRLKNAIEETELAITEGKRPDKPNALPWTPEEIALRDQLSEVKTRLDDVLNQPENDKLTGILQRVEAVRERIKSGDIGVKLRKAGPETKEVTQAKDELAALNKELSDLRKAQREKENPPRTPDEKKLAAMEKQRDDLFARVSKGDTSTRIGKPTADTAEQAKVRAEIDALNEKMAEMRKAGQPTKPQDEAQLKALEKRLAAAQAKLAAGDLSTAPKKATVDTARVAKARDELGAINKQIQELRSASEDIRLARDKQRIQTQIRTLQDRIARNDYEERPRREPALDREKIDLQFELAKEKEKWQQGLIEAKRAKRSLPRKIFEAAGEGVNLARQLVTSGDFPPVFRQGLFAIGRPITTAKAVADSFKAMVSEKQRFRIMKEINDRPNAPLYSRSKLYLAKDTAQPLSQQEENFMGNWFKQLPRWTIVGPLLRASERSYNTFLNKLRADTFDSAVNAFNISETDTASLNSLAANINTFTGRSTLPTRALEQSAPGLNAFLFAPRFMMSRFKVAVGQPLWGGTAKSRMAALDTYARTLGGIATIYALGQMAGGEVETDPRSSDFGKIRLGDTRLDPLGGLSQVTTLLARVTSGETKTGKGRLVPLREENRPLAGTSMGAKGKPNPITGDTSDVLKNFLRSKLNPAVGSAVNLAVGKDITGEPVTPQSTLVSMTVPISYQDILSTMEKQGVPRGAALFTLSLFGMGLNTYEDRKK